MRVDGMACPIDRERSGAGAEDFDVSNAYLGVVWSAVNQATYSVR